jgi:hypothetical protein
MSTLWRAKPDCQRNVCQRNDGQRNGNYGFSPSYSAAHHSPDTFLCLIPFSAFFHRDSVKKAAPLLRPSLIIGCIFGRARHSVRTALLGGQGIARPTAPKCEKCEKWVLAVFSRNRLPDNLFQAKSGTRIFRIFRKIFGGCGEVSERLKAEEDGIPVKLKVIRGN